MRRDRLQRPHGHLRIARLERSYPRDDSREAADVGDQEGGARGRDAVPPGIGGRARHGRHDDPARNQQGHVRRMSMLSIRDAPAPAVALEIAADRVSAASLDWRGGKAYIASHAVEPLPDGVVVPSLTASN